MALFGMGKGDGQVCGHGLFIDGPAVTVEAAGAVNGNQRRPLCGDIRRFTRFSRSASDPSMGRLARCPATHQRRCPDSANQLATVSSPRTVLIFNLGLDVQHSQFGEVILVVMFGVYVSLPEIGADINWVGLV